MGYKNDLSISEAIEEIRQNNYLVPLIQREYIWNTEKIENLFDSVLRGYPIGTFLFWVVSKNTIRKDKYTFYEFLKCYDEYANKSIHNVKTSIGSNNKITAVLDGQQRLTSLYIGLKGYYTKKAKYQNRKNKKSYIEYKLYINLVNKCSKDDPNNKKYDFRFIDQNNITNSNDEYWFKVEDILYMKDADLSMYLIDNIYSKYNKKQYNLAEEILNKLNRSFNSEGVLNYYEEKK